MSPQAVGSACYKMHRICSTPCSTLAAGLSVPARWKGKAPKLWLIPLHFIPRPSPIRKEPPAAQLPPGPAVAVVAFPVCDSGITYGKGVLGQFVHALDGAEIVLFCIVNLSVSCLGPSYRPARRGCPPGDGRPPCCARPPPPASHPSDGGSWGGPSPFSSPFPCQGHNFGLHNFSPVLLLSAQTAPMLAPLAPELPTQAALGCELSPAAKAMAGSSTSQGTAQKQGSSLCPP